MAVDWKDILGSISMPQGESEEEKRKEIKETSSLNKKVSIFYEKKGRGGKEVTILADFEGIEENEIKQLSSELKKILSVGGSYRDREILIQGDCRKRIRQILIEKGFKIKG